MCYSRAQLQAQAAAGHAAALNQLLAESAIALAVMTVVSAVLGWLVAGRVLRPLRAMTAAARAISADDLSRRLAVPGPDDELKDLGDTIDELLDRLEIAFGAQRRFAASASHELRTPLAMMRTSLDVATAKPGPVPPELTVLAGKLREGLDQADRLVENLLLLARAQHGARDDSGNHPPGPAARRRDRGPGRADREHGPGRAAQRRQRRLPAHRHREPRAAGADDRQPHR